MFLMKNEACTPSFRRIGAEDGEWGGNAITLKSGHLGVACGAPYGLIWASLCLGGSCGMLYQYAKFKKKKYQCVHEINYKNN